MKQARFSFLFVILFVQQLFITNVVQSQSSKVQNGKYGVIEKDPITGTYRVKPGSISEAKPVQSSEPKKSMLDLQRFEKGLELEKRFTAQHKEMEKRHQVQEQAMLDREMKQLFKSPKLNKIKFLGKETEFYEGPRVSTKKVSFRSTNSMVTNVQINGKQTDTIYATDSFMLSFSFAPNTVSAIINVYFDINNNGIVDGDDFPIIDNGVVFDDGEIDQNVAAGQFKYVFPKGNLYSTMISSLIFEINDYQSVSSAILVVKDRVSSKVISGTITPMFKNTIVSLNSPGQNNQWNRYVIPDSAGKFITYVDSTASKTAYVYVDNIDKTPHGYLPPSDTNLTLNKDTIRFKISYKVATEFVEGYVKDQFGSPVINGIILVYMNSGLRVSDVTDSTGYYKLGVKKGELQMHFNSPSGSDEYMHSNNQNNYLTIGSLQTVRKDYVLLKAQSSISGSIKFGSIGVTGVPVTAYNDSMFNQVYTKSNGNYSLKVFKPSNTNVPYSVNTGIDDNGYYIDSVYRQNILTGATNVNFTMKKITGGLQGRVTDQFTGKPVKNVYVNVSGNVYRYAQTDDSGYYKVRLPAGQYSIYANAPYYENYEEYNIVVANTFVTKNITMMRTGSFSGSIMDESGNPVLGAYIYALDSLGNYYGNSNGDNQGNYVVSNMQTSSYKAQVNASGFIAQWYNKKLTMESATLFKVTKGFDTPNINFVLSRGGSISGIVKNKNGIRIPDINVVVRDTSFNNYWYAMTDDSGKYSVSGLQSGKYYVATSSNDYLTQWYNGVGSNENATKVSVIIYQNTPNINFTVSTGGIISGKVTNKLGEPIFNAEVVSIDTNSYLTSSAYTNDSGMYKLNKIIPGKKIYVTARADGYSRRWYNNAQLFETASPLMLSDEEEKQQINFILPVSGKISGTVKTKSGIPIQSANIYAVAINGTTSRYGYSDQSGMYTIDNLDKGKYLVYSSTIDYAEQWYNHKTSMVLADTVFVQEETTTSNINFDLLQGGKITGTVKNTAGTPVQYASIYVNKTDGTYSYSVSSDEEGKYSINNVQPGKYVALTDHWEYFRQYYNHKSSQALSDTITVAAEETKSNINFDLIHLPPPSTDSIVIKITLANIPDTLVFSKTGLPDYEVDYWWGFRMDVDNNPATGPTWAPGCEIELMAFHYKVPGQQEYKSNIIDGTFHVLIEWVGDNGTWKQSNVPISVDKNDKKSIVIKASKNWPELNPITLATKYYVHTSALIGDKTGSDNTVLSSGFVAMSDPPNDFGRDYIDCADILKVTPNIVTAVNDISQAAVPLSFSLEQNYPNPFNPTTNIRYGLPATSKVKISIYNILGQVVNVLVDEEQSAGWKEVQWNAKNVSSGIYFYKIETTGNGGNSFVETKKMLLIR